MKRFAIRLWLGSRRFGGLAIIPKILGPLLFWLMCLFGSSIIAAIGDLTGVHDYSLAFFGWFALAFGALFTGIGIRLSLSGKGGEWLNRLPGAAKLGRKGRISVAADGLLLEVGKHSRFVSYEEIGDAYAVKGGRVILKHTDGTSTGLSLGDSEAFVTAILEAREGFIEAAKKPVPALPSALRPDALGGYRGGPSFEDIARVALSPSADPEARVNAIRALVGAPEPVRVKLRVAAEETAHPEVQEAFEEVTRDRSSARD
jgi:hypothetical protein